MASYNIADVLVIGAGASRTAFTWRLSQAGIRMVCLEHCGLVSSFSFPVSEPDAQLHLQTGFYPNPSVRRLPEDYAVNDTETP